MASKLRSVNTKFWDDSFIQDLTSSEKLLFLYLLTNPLTNILGIYEISIKRMMFDTGLKEEEINNALKRFETIRKAFFVQNIIILPNWLKNQHLNSNMRIAAAKEFYKLPKSLQDNILGKGYEWFSNDSKGFEMIPECLEKKEREIEEEREIEKEEERMVPPSPDSIKKFGLENGYNLDGYKIFDYYNDKNWKDSKGNKVKDWKKKIKTIWFKPEYKIQKKKIAVSKEGMAVLDQELIVKIENGEVTEEKALESCK